MKKIVLAVLTVGFCFSGFSQEVEKTEQKPERIRLVKGGESKPVTSTTKVEKEQTPAQELRSCEAQLIALNKKEEYLRANAEEFKTATEAGWFKDAEKTRATLNKRIAELKLELKK